MTQAQQYGFRVYGQAEGLQNLSINATAIDRKGFLWVATENGVYRFLGASFERFGTEQGIQEVDIRDIYQDPAGTLWVGTDQDLFRWDGQRFFAATKAPIHFQGPHRIAAEDARDLLVVDKLRLYRLEHDAEGRTLSYKPLFTDALISSDPDLGQVFSVSVVLQPDGGVRVWFGGGKKLYSFAEPRGGGPLQPTGGDVTEWGIGKGLAPDRWAGVRLGGDGTLWAEGMHRVAAMPPGSRGFVDRSIPGGDPESVINRATLIEDPQGRMLAAGEDGIARWDGTGWRIFGRANGFERNSFIVGTAFDADGDLWIASRGDGLYHWTGYSDWEGWALRQGLPSAAVWALMPDGEKRTIAGTESGPASIDLRSGATRRLFSEPHWKFGLVQTIDANPGGSLFAATLSGLVLRIDPATRHSELVARLPAFIISSFHDQAGRAFFATDEGIYLLDPASKAASPGRVAEPRRVAEIDSLLGNSRRVEAGCAAPDGSAWFVANSRLLHYQAGKWSMPQVSGMDKINGTLLAIFCARDGSIWATGEQAGAWRVTNANGPMTATRVELPPELRSLACLAILVDGRGWVWLGSDSGLAVWNGQRWRHLTQESGLISNDVDQGSLSEGPDGSLWIGTSGGVSHLLHPERVFDLPAPGISLTEIRHGDTDYTGAQEIVLPWGGAPLSFRVSSPATMNRSELVLKIRMVGNHPDWIETQDGVAIFSRLAPGEYTFAAMACNRSLNACSAVLTVPVRILPPWWRSNWFFALCGVVFLLLLAAGDRIRARHLRQRSRQLEAMVHQRTLELEERTRELEASREQLRIQAVQDGLTGLLNHEAVLSELETEMARAHRESRTFVVAMADLDHFKRVNDTHGHLAGDEVLRSFAAALNAAARAYDKIGRYGGEEFLLVLTGIPQEAIESRLASLHAAISNLEVRIGDFSVQITCSVGATMFDPSEGLPSAEALLAVADRALYEAKASGRNRVVFHARFQPAHDGKISQGT